MELQPASGEVQYLYVSMDAFSDDMGKIGIPTVASGARFSAERGKHECLLERKKHRDRNKHRRWQHLILAEQLRANNAAKVPNADSASMIFGDDIAGDGNLRARCRSTTTDAKQTLFAFNHWVAAPPAIWASATTPAATPTGPSRETAAIPHETAAGACACEIDRKIFSKLSAFGADSSAFASHAGSSRPLTCMRVKK